MYCPRCAQEHVSEDLRFCSDCGLHLSWVLDVLESGGTPKYVIEVDRPKRLLKRRLGLLVSFFWLVVFFLFFAPFFGKAGSEIGALFMAVTGVFGSATIAVISLYVGSDKRKSLAVGQPRQPRVKEDRGVIELGAV